MRAVGRLMGAPQGGGADVAQLKQQQDEQAAQIEKQNADMAAVERGRRKIGRGGLSLMSFLDEQMNTRLGG